MHDYIVYFLIAVWLIVMVALFAHELWIFCKYPEDWDRRDQGMTYIPDWQVWLTMVFWPIVLIGAIVFAAITFISVNATVYWQNRKAGK